MKSIIHYRTVLLIMIVMFTMNVNAQDSTSMVKSYHIFGFQFSLVSGTGVSLGKVINNKIKLKATGGIISSNQETDYSFGFDMHYFLSSGTKYEISVGPSFGAIGSTNESSVTRVAVATSLEVPFDGSEHYNNLCGGVILYYPTFYLKSGDVNATVGFYLSYNF